MNVQSRCFSGGSTLTSWDPCGLPRIWGGRHSSFAAAPSNIQSDALSRGVGHGDDRDGGQDVILQPLQVAGVVQPTDISIDRNTRRARLILCVCAASET